MKLRHIFIQKIQMEFYELGVRLTQLKMAAIVQVYH